MARGRRGYLAAECPIESLVWAVSFKPLGLSATNSVSMGSGKLVGKKWLSISRPMALLPIWLVNYPTGNGQANSAKISTSPIPL